MNNFQEQLMAIKTKMDKEEIKDSKSIEAKEIVYSNNINKKITIDKTNYNNKEEKKQVKKGQLWYVDFGQRRGSLQSGVRPALVDSNDINNRFSNIINVYPLTSNMAKASNIPVHVTVEGFGLKEQSVILIEQDTPIDVRYQLLTYIGTVDELVLKKVEKARNIQRGILQEKSPLEKLPKYVQDDINETLQFIYSYEKVLGRSKTNNLNHLLSERSMLLDHLERICKDNGINYKDYYVEYTRERKISIG